MRFRYVAAILLGSVAAVCLLPESAHAQLFRRGWGGNSSGYGGSGYGGYSDCGSGYTGGYAGGPVYGGGSPGGYAGGPMMYGQGQMSQSGYYPPQAGQPGQFGAQGQFGSQSQYGPQPGQPGQRGQFGAQGQYGPGQPGQPGQFGTQGQFQGQYGSQGQYGAPGQFGPGGPGMMAAAGGMRTIDVAVNDGNFEPRTLNVQPGTIVRWTNRGREQHTVTSSDNRWGQELPPGASFALTFQFPGTYNYVCKYHENTMHGSITVSQQGGPGAQPMPPGPGARPGVSGSEHGEHGTTGTTGTDRSNINPPTGKGGTPPPEK